MNILAETYKHKKRVAELMGIMIKHLITAANKHDDSKLETPEKEIFNKYTPLLAKTTYGSKTYKKYLTEMKPALDHHYENNAHHPQHFSGQNGLDGMSLINLVEMIADWKAATERHNNGDIGKSIDINQKRFGYSDEVRQIFINTLIDLNWI